MKKRIQIWSLLTKKFNDIWARNYNEYIAESKENHPLIKPTFIFIEEFSLLLSKAETIDEKYREKIIKIVKNIAIAGRSVGFNLVFSLQVPLIWVIKDSEISRMLKTISFKLDNSLNSNAFGTQVPIDISTLKTWEWVFKVLIYTKNSKHFLFQNQRIKIFLKNLLQKSLIKKTILNMLQKIENSTTMKH